MRGSYAALRARAPGWFCSGQFTADIDRLPSVVSSAKPSGPTSGLQGETCVSPPLCTFEGCDRPYAEFQRRTGLWLTLDQAHE